MRSPTVTWFVWYVNGVLALLAVVASANIYHPDVEWMGAADSAVAIGRPAMNGGGAIGAAQHAACGDDYHVDEQMLAVASMPRVRQRFESRSDRFDINELGHVPPPCSGDHGVPREGLLRDRVLPLWEQDVPELRRMRQSA